MKKSFITVEKVLEFANFQLESEKVMFANEPQKLKELDVLVDAIEEIEMAIVNPEMRDSVVEEYIGSDPYCWCFLPNFAELEEEGIDIIEVEFPDGEVTSAPLLF